MELQSPIIYNGKTYTEYAVSLSSAIVPRGTNSYTTAVNISAVPMLTNEDGTIELMDRNAVDENGNLYLKQFITSDIKNCGNMNALQAFGIIAPATENFINTL